MTEQDLMNALHEFEMNHDINIYACRDFGSRAKGLAGPDSDRDALFLFDQDPRAYKRLDGSIDNIVTEKNGIDFQGWNTRKFAELLSDSNPTAIEFLNSPENYYEWERIAPELRDLQRHATENFRPIALYYHYRSLAERQYRKHIKSQGDTTSDPSLKRNLVCIRAIACAEYIRDTLEFPPLQIEDLLSEANSSDQCISILTTLTERKRDGEGDEMIGNEYGDFIEGWLDFQPDHDRLEIRGIDRGRCDLFIERITDAHEY